MKRIIFLLSVMSILRADVPILQHITKKYDKIQNFQSKVTIKTDIPNFRMPVKTVDIFYLAPDSLRLKAEGFALLPKTGFLPFRLLRKLDSIQTDTSYQVRLKNKDITILEYRDSSLIKSGTLKLVLDNYLERVDQIVVSNEADTLSIIDFKYQNTAGFWLPETTMVTFKLGKQIPLASSPTITNPFGSIAIGSAESHYEKSGQVTLIFKEITLGR